MATTYTLERNHWMGEAARSHTPVYRVLVADGSAMFRRGLTGLLGVHPDLEVVGEATDVTGLLQLARQLRPKVVVLDATIPGGADEAVRELVRQVQGVSILVLSSNGSRAEASRALAAGASGYVLKEAEPELLVAAIVAAAHGYGVSPRPIMNELGRAGNPAGHSSELLDGLSPREFEVLRDLADGMTTKVLANRLGISEKTVRNHIASMYAKLGLHDRSQLVRYAIQKGLSRPLELV